MDAHERAIVLGCIGDLLALVAHVERCHRIGVVPVEAGDMAIEIAENLADVAEGQELFAQLVPLVRQGKVG